MSRQRLDAFLVASGHFPSRSKARDSILRGCVEINGRLANKPGAFVVEPIQLTINDPATGYVARSALKLIAALDAFELSVKGCSCLDVGQSTGGFTQVLVERGATHVTGVDIGHGQLHPSLQQHPRVSSHVGINARHASDIPPGLFELITIDVSFISLTEILPAIADRAKPSGHIVALFKPQFEVGRRAIGKGGVVVDDAATENALSRVREEALRTGLALAASIRSPISGSDGNQEQLLHLVGAR
ncbi:MAG: TlyA family RNA methyltransferase [Pseudomonadota bacterium]